MSTEFSLSNPNRPLQIGVFLPASTTELIDIAPVDLLNGLQPHFLSTVPPIAMTDGMKAAAVPSDISWITEGRKPAQLTAGLKVEATHDFESCPKLDILLMGAAEGMYNASTAEKEFLRKVAADGAVFLAVCGGFSLLLQAGLLQGRTATAPRVMLDYLKKHEPAVNWVDKRWVNDQGLWTSGAALHGVDLVAEFLRSTWSEGDRGRLVRWLLEFGGWNVGRTVEYAAGEALGPDPDQE